MGIFYVAFNVEWNILKVNAFIKMEYIKDRISKKYQMRNFIFEIIGIFIE